MAPVLPLTASGHAPRQQWRHQLDLLCRLGVGLAPVAPDVCAALRALVGADAVSLFWLDTQGLPAGFFHEDSPGAVQNLFLNEFERLFVGDHETNVLALARPEGPRVGRLLAPDARHFRSNTYNLLVRASGHHHILDMRVEVQGQTRAVVALYRGATSRAFDADDAAALERTAGHLARAFTLSATSPWAPSHDSAPGHVLLDAVDWRPVLADATAVALLRRARLRGLGLTEAGNEALPPDLALRLGLRADAATLPRRIPVPHGVLEVSAEPMHPPAGGPPQMLMRLQLQRPRQIDVVRKVMALRLSPLQREIAALAGLGHARADCGALTGVGPAALKKHLRVILDAAGAQDWDGLAQVLRA